MYLEASYNDSAWNGFGPNQGDSFILTTPSLANRSDAAEGLCLVFWYNMYGAPDTDQLDQMGWLNVSQHTVDGTDDIMWSQKGDQGRKLHFNLRMDGILLVLGRISVPTVSI